MTAKEATRLTARQKSTENRVEQVKNMLAFFMHVRRLRRLEGELNIIRLQKGGQASLQINRAGRREASLSGIKPPNRVSLHRKGMFTLKHRV